MKGNNIILIGMPGCGKSTIGVVLAKVLGYEFTDSDLLIQKKEGRLLREIIAEEGEEAFIRIENEVNAGIETDKHVICSRLGNIRRRGVVLKDGQTLKDLYDERIPLYEKYADVIVDAEGYDIEGLMDEVVHELQKITEFE